MAKERKCACPKCGGQLLFCVKAESTIMRKINQDGRLSKVVHQGTKHITDIYYLQCDKYRCDFVYNITYPTDAQKNYPELDDWYDEFGEDFK